MTLTDLLQNFYRTTRSLMRPALFGLALVYCGPSVDDSDRNGCRSDYDCREPRVCEQGVCVKEKNRIMSPTNQNENDPPDLCCGKVIYATRQRRLRQFNLNELHDEPFIKEPSFSFDSFRISLDSSRLVFTDIGALDDEPIATITDIDGNILNTVRYTPSSIRERVIPGSRYERGVCQLLSNNQSLVVILGEDNVSKGGYSYFQSQIYRMELDGRLSQLTSPTQGIENVRSMIVTPGDIIYFFGDTGTIPNRQPRLWRSSISNWNPTQVPLTTENPAFHEMNWMVSTGQLLVRSGGEVFIVNVETGVMEQLTFNHPIETDHPSLKKLILSHNETRIIYPAAGLADFTAIYDIARGRDWNLSNENYPCEDTICFQAKQGVWLP